MDEVAREGWRMRPVLLGVLGALSGLVAHLLLGNGYRFDLGAFQVATLAFVTVAPGLIGFTLERERWTWSLGFALVGGLVAAGVIYGSGPTSGWDEAGGWRVFSLFLAIVIAAPLFQAARDAGAARFAYPAVHDHAWTDIVLWCASWAFVGVTLLLTVLLGGLFHLIRIDLLQDLLRENWFLRVLVGAAFGTGLGVLREHDALVRLLRKVVTTVLAVLAPVLAFGLALFVLALPFTGLDALWDATDATTPILLSCALGALILANVVIGNGPEEEARNPVLRTAALVLAAVMLPFAVIAAIATGLRIGQYGYTPERLWALTFVIVASAVGLAYLVALVRGRLGWAVQARSANRNIAFGLCGVALLLATPLISFNAISTRDQVARLESGKVSPEAFDWRALAFEFGAPGRGALARLAKSGNAAIREQAIAAKEAPNRWNLSDGREARRLETLDKRLRILPAGHALPADLRALVASNYTCDDDKRCTLAFPGQGREALLLQDACFVYPDPEPTPLRGNKSVLVGRTSLAGCMPVRFVFLDDKWQDEPSRVQMFDSADAQSRASAAAGYKTGAIEIRPVQRRQAFVGGVPVGDVFE